MKFRKWLWVAPYYGWIKVTLNDSTYIILLIRGCLKICCIYGPSLAQKLHYLPWICRGWESGPDTKRATKLLQGRWLKLGENRYLVFIFCNFLISASSIFMFPLLWFFCDFVSFKMVACDIIHTNYEQLKEIKIENGDLENAKHHTDSY